MASPPLSRPNCINCTILSQIFFTLYCNISLILQKKVCAPQQSTCPTKVLCNAKLNLWHGPLLQYIYFLKLIINRFFLFILVLKVCKFFQIF